MWSIVADSSCDLEINAMEDEVLYQKVPFYINVGDEVFVDTDDLDISKLVDAFEHCKEASQTACPSPDAWYQCFLKADHIIAITISSKLSGSYNSAMAAKGMIQENYPDKSIHILDSKSAGSALVLLVLKAKQYISEGISFQNIVEKLERDVEQEHTIFALSSFNNLIKNGRLSKISGFIAGKLNLKAIGVEKDGAISLKQKVRGSHKLVQYLIEDIKLNGYSGGVIIISHCLNPEMADEVQDEIEKIWKDADITILQTGGLCSYYAEKYGLILAY